MPMTETDMTPSEQAAYERGRADERLDRDIHKLTRLLIHRQIKYGPDAIARHEHMKGTDNG